jgi:hypothetical protein
VSLELVPIDLATAKAFIREHHRHHLPTMGWKFGIGVAVDGVLVGVACVGRPVARGLDDGRTLEVTRCCTDGSKNAASMLYGAAYRAAKSMGFKRIVTYLLASETGTTMLAAGWDKAATVKGGSWDRPSRPREDKHPTEDKVRWEIACGD